MLQDKINQLAEERTSWLLNKDGGLREVRNLLQTTLKITYETANLLVENIAEKCRAFTLARITENIESDMMKGAS